MPTSEASRRRRLRLLANMQGLPIDEAFLRDVIRADLEAEAFQADPDALITPDAFSLLRELIAAKQAQEPMVPRDSAAPGLFFSAGTVVIVPGCLASTLTDTTSQGLGLIWLNPDKMISSHLGALQLGSYDGTESDLHPNVRVAPTGVVPILYDLLRLALEVRRFRTEIFPVDWRKDLDIAARLLAIRLRGLAAEPRPVHLVAHSQGALVARRALQLLGEVEARKAVQRLILLGPANYGSLSAALALGGSHGMLSWVRRLGVEPPQGFHTVLASMTGLYQLLPWDCERVPWLANHHLGEASFWKQGIDVVRLSRFLGWGRVINTSFFSDRTTVVIGDNHGSSTMAGAIFHDLVLRSLPEHDMAGDGTVPHSCAVLPGTASLLAPGTEHMTMTIDRRVIGAVIALLTDQPVGLPCCSSDPADHLASPPSATSPLPTRAPTGLSSQAAESFPPHAIEPVAHERPGTFLPPYDRLSESTDSPGALPHSRHHDRLLQGAKAGDARWPGAAFELILDTCELLPFEFLRIGDRLGRAVVKIQCVDGAVGTGFLVAPGILLTNNHVLPDVATATGSYALANYESTPSNDAAGRPAVAPLDAPALFVTNADLDFTFCAVQGLDFLGTIPVDRNSMNVSVLEYVNIIQHPRGRPKEVALQDNRVVKADNVVIQYACDTEPGSSGSPVFNNQWRLVALHHASVVTDSPEGRSAAGADPSARYLNEGIRLSAIATWLETAEANTLERPEQVATLRRVFSGLDPQIGFFGALGRRAHGKTAAEVVVNSYRDTADDVDIGFWNLPRLSRRFRENLSDVARVVSELGLDVWCLNNVHPASIRALCEHLETNYQLNYGFLLADPLAQSTSAAVFKRSKALVVQQLAWSESSLNASGIPVHLSVRKTAQTRDPIEFHLIIVPGDLQTEEDPGNAGLRRALFDALGREISSATPATDWVLTGSSGSLLPLNDTSAWVDMNHEASMATAERDGAIAFLSGPDSRVDQIFVSPNGSLATGRSGSLSVTHDRSLPQSVTSLARPYPIAARVSFRREARSRAAPPNVLPVPPATSQASPVPSSPAMPVTPTTFVLDTAFEQKLTDLLTPIIARIVAETQQQTRQSAGT
jgi:V8-like Glu-specific endopeptidase